MSNKIQRAALTLGAAVLVLGFVACGGGSTAAEGPAVGTSAVEARQQAEPRESAEEFMVRMIDLAFSGQHGRRWDGLHPEQQALVTRSRFMECSAELGTGVPVEVKALESYEEPVELQGREVPSVAVVVEYSGAIGAFGQQGTLVSTFHAIRVGNTWRWLLPQKSMDAFQADTCPLG